MTERRERYDTTVSLDGILGAAMLTTGMLTRARDNLRQAVDELGQVITDLVSEMRTDELKGLLGRQARELAEARAEAVEAWKAVKDAEWEAEELRRDFVLAWKAENGGQVVDPTTGKANVKHTELVLAAAMSRDPEVAQAEADLRQAESDYRRAQARVEQLQDQLSATRHAARLVAAELVYLAGPAAAVGPLTRLAEGSGQA